MELTPQDVVDGIIAEAHDACGGVAAEAKHYIVAELARLEGSGAAWVADLLGSYTAVGAAKAYSDWRRGQVVAGATRKGTEVNVPAFGAVVRQSEDGEPVYVQLALEGMTLEELRQRRDRLARQRDTLSVEVRFFSDLIEVMESDQSLATAGDALRKLGMAA